MPDTQNHGLAGGTLNADEHIRRARDPQLYHAVARRSQGTATWIGHDRLPPDLAPQVFGFQFKTRPGCDC